MPARSTSPPNRRAIAAGRLPPPRPKRPRPSPPRFLPRTNSGYRRITVERPLRLSAVQRRTHRHAALPERGAQCRHAVDLRRIWSRLLARRCQLRGLRPARRLRPRDSRPLQAPLCRPQGKADQGPARRRHLACAEARPAQGPATATGNRHGAVPTTSMPGTIRSRLPAGKPASASTPRRKSRSPTPSAGRTRQRKRSSRSCTRASRRRSTACSRSARRSSNIRPTAICATSRTSPSTRAAR